MYTGVCMDLCIYTHGYTCVLIWVCICMFSCECGAWRMSDVVHQVWPRLFWKTGCLTSLELNNWGPGVCLSLPPNLPALSLQAHSTMSGFFMWVLVNESGSSILYRKYLTHWTLSSGPKCVFILTTCHDHLTFEWKFFFLPFTRWKISSLAQLLAHPNIIHPKCLLS